MKPIVLATLLLCFLPLPRLVAGDESAKAPAPSAFDASKITRDPFERIDAKYLAQRSAVVVSAEGNLDQLFKLTALSVDRLSIAVINGKAFAEKESFIVRTKDREIRTTVVKISDNAVELDCGGTAVKVPITREKPSLQEEENPEATEAP